MKKLDKLEIQMPLKALLTVLPELKKQDESTIGRIKKFASYSSFNHNEMGQISKLKNKSFNERVKELKGGINVKAED